MHAAMLVLLSHKGVTLSPYVKCMYLKCVCLHVNEDTICHTVCETWEWTKCATVEFLEGITFIFPNVTAAGLYFRWGNSLTALCSRSPGYTAPFVCQNKDSSHMHPWIQKINSTLPFNEMVAGETWLRYEAGFETKENEGGNPATLCFLWPLSHAHHYPKINPVALHNRKDVWNPVTSLGLVWSRVIIK